MLTGLASQVARHFAVKLLQQQSTWERREFMSAWRDALPEVSCHPFPPQTARG